MRTITGLERTRLSNDHANFYLRVEVKDGAGTYRDLTAEGGVNYIDSVTWSASIDQPVMTGTVTMKREHRTLSLAPLVATSPLNLIGALYAPLLDVGRSIRISTAVTLPGVAPLTGDWKEVFLGVITDIDFSSDPMSLTIADLGSVLLDTQIELAQTYGDAGGIPVETVMQSILDDNVGAGIITLYTPVSPTWNILPYEQATGGLLDALRALAIQIGWDVRYMYDASNVFRLTFFNPDRAKTTADATIGPSEYLSVQRLSISNADVRNVVKVNYQDKVSLNIGSAIASDSGSILEFQRRYMEIGEGSSSNIDTQAEAQAMADAAVSDLSQPLADQVIEQFYFWPVAVGDLLGYTANGVHYTDDQKFGVIAYTHTLALNTHRTSIAVRGHVAGAYRQWLLTRNGLFSGQISTGPAPLIFALQGEVQAYDDPRRDGMIYQQVRFDKASKFIDLYAHESVTPNVPMPDFANNRNAYRLQRQDGDQWNTDTLEMIVAIATRASYYRRVIGVGISAAGELGPYAVHEIQAIDVGTGPSAAPSALALTPAAFSNRLTWTVGDATAHHILFRNGFGKVLDPGVAAFLDNNIQVDIAHTYSICAFKNGQTSTLMQFGTATPTGGAVNAPTWQAGYPLGFSNNSVDFRWTAPVGTDEIVIEVSPFLIVGLFIPLYAFTDGGHVPTGAVVDASEARGTVLSVRLRGRIAGVYYYSDPIKVTWGSAGNLAPDFANGTPWRTVGDTTFQWKMPPSVTALLLTSVEVWAQVVAGGPMTLLHHDTGSTTMLDGTFVYTATDLAGLNAQMRANYLVGPQASGPVVRINGAL